MTAEDLDALAADVGHCYIDHGGCDMFCKSRRALEIARGYLSLRLVQADHERQIVALQAAYDDVQAALMKSIAQVEDLRDRLMDADEDISKLKDAQY
jgi:light-regulated signal transduction histidine kinase (bacteriophytochrome)